MSTSKWASFAHSVLSSSDEETNRQNLGKSAYILAKLEGDIGRAKPYTTYV